LAKIPYYVALTTYFAYGLLFVYGHLRDFFRSLIRTEKSDKVVFFSPCFCLPAPPPGFFSCRFLDSLKQRSAELYPMQKKKLDFRSRFWDSPQDNYDPVQKDSSTWRRFTTGRWL
jgi:hypothetical protein